MQTIHKTEETPLEAKFIEEFQLKTIRGLVLSSHPLIKEEFIEAAMDYKAKDGDVVVLGFPKTGSTWVTYIIWEILHKGEVYPDLTDMYGKYAPGMDMAGTDAIEALQPPRLYRSHLPCRYINLNKNAKYVYVYRNPGDVLVSYYHFGKFYVENDVQFDTFFEGFMKAQVWYGDYFDHVLHAYAHKDDDNFLLVSYEHLKENTRDEMLRIAKFLGEEHESALKSDERLIQKILEVTNFDYMKARLKLVIRRDPKNQGPINFFRTGVAGDSKKYLSEEQRRILNEKIREKMKDTDLHHHWLS